MDWGSSSSHILPGYKELADAMLEVAVYSARKNRNYNVSGREFTNAKRALSAFIRYNFDVDNSDSVRKESRIFTERKFCFTQGFITALTNFAPIKYAPEKYYKRSYQEKLDSSRFWNNICSIMYHLLTRGEEKFVGESKVVRFQCKGYYIQVKQSSAFLQAKEQAVQTQIVQKPVKSEPLPSILLGIEAIVLTENRKCIHQEHPIRDVLISVRVATPSGEIKRYTMQAGYCEICREYLVLDTDFNQVRQHGVILCPVIDRRETATKPQAKARSFSETESRIHRLGYNVQQEVGYTDKQRQVILANIIENTDITIHEIKSNINGNINPHRSQLNYEEAVGKWRKDLEFLSEYHIGDLPEVKVERIVIGQRGK